MAPRCWMHPDSWRRCSLGRFGGGFFFGDEYLRDDADVGLPPVAPLDRAVRQRHRPMGVHVGPALGVSGDAAEQRNDFCLFVEFDLFLPEAVLDVAPAEGRLVDGAHPGEMTVADVVLLG